MTILFIILIVLASVVLGFIVLVQNPKGGGLAGNVAGFSNQFMGVKQTTDVLEKGTWIFAGIIAILCIVSVLFISRTATTNSTTPGVDGSKIPLPVNATAPVQQPAPNTTVLPTTATPDSTK